MMYLLNYDALVLSIVPGGAQTTNSVLHPALFCATAVILLQLYFKPACFIFPHLSSRCFSRTLLGNDVEKI